MKSQNPVALIFNDLKIKGIVKTQKEFADRINFQAPEVNRVIRGHKPPSQTMAQSIYGAFHYNLDFIMGLSGIMKDEARDLLDDLLRIFSEIKTTPVSYTDNQNEEVNVKIVTLSVNESLYKFLIDYEHAEALKQEGMMSYFEEMQKISKMFLSCKDDAPTLKCYLIPVNQQKEIIDSDERHSNFVSQSLDHLDFIDHPYSKSPKKSINIRLNKTELLDQFAHGDI